MESVYKIVKDICVGIPGRQIFPYYPPANKLLNVPNFCWQRIKITEKERLCLELYLQGMTSKEIGKRLSRSHRTVEVHIKNIREKLKANSRSKIYTKAKEMGLLKQFCLER